MLEKNQVAVVEIARYGKLRVVVEDYNLDNKTYELVILPSNTANNILSSTGELIVAEKNLKEISSEKALHIDKRQWPTAILADYICGKTLYYQKESSRRYKENPQSQKLGHHSSGFTHLYKVAHELRDSYYPEQVDLAANASILANFHKYLGTAGVGAGVRSVGRGTMKRIKKRAAILSLEQENKSPKAWNPLTIIKGRADLTKINSDPKVARLSYKATNKPVENLEDYTPWAEELNPAEHEKHLGILLAYEGRVNSNSENYDNWRNRNRGNPAVDNICGGGGNCNCPSAVRKRTIMWLEDGLTPQWTSSPNLQLEGNFQNKCYFMPRANRLDPTHFPLPPFWPEKYKRRLQGEIEQNALRGQVNGRQESYRTWVNRYIHNYSFPDLTAHDAAVERYKMWWGNRQ